MGLQKDKNKTSILLILQKKNHLFTLAFITRLDIKLAISLYQTSTHPIHPFVTYPLHPWSPLPRHPFLTRLPTHTHFFSLSLLFSVFSFILYRFLISAQRALRTPGEIEGWLKWAARWQEHRGSEGERERRRHVTEVRTSSAGAPSLDVHTRARPRGETARSRLSEHALRSRRADWRTIAGMKCIIVAAVHERAPER